MDLYELVNPTIPVTVLQEAERLGGNALNGSSDASNRRISFAEKVKANASMEIDLAALPIPGMKDEDDNAEDGEETWQTVAMKKYKPAWMVQEHADDEDNSKNGEEPWQIQKMKGSKTKGKDVDPTPRPPRARNFLARYK